MNDFPRPGPYLEMMQRVVGETAVTIRPIQVFSPTTTTNQAQKALSRRNLD